MKKKANCYKTNSFFIDIGTPGKPPNCAEVHCITERKCYAMTLQFQFPKWPTFGEQEERAVEDVVRSGQLFANQKVREFEKSFGKYIGTEHALGLGNATQGLHLCLAALGIDRR